MIKQCHYCGVKANRRKLTKDHCIPKWFWKYCGLNNIHTQKYVYSCDKCNQDKCGMPYITFMACKDDKLELNRQRKYWDGTTILIKEMDRNTYLFQNIKKIMIQDTNFVEIFTK